MNFQMFKLDLEKAEQPEIKLPVLLYDEITLVGVGLALPGVPLTDATTVGAITQYLMNYNLVWLHHMYHYY